MASYGSVTTQDKFAFASIQAAADDSREDFVRSPDKYVIPVFLSSVSPNSSSFTLTSSGVNVNQGIRSYCDQFQTKTLSSYGQEITGQYYNTLILKVLSDSLGESGIEIGLQYFDRIRDSDDYILAVKYSDGTENRVVQRSDVNSSFGNMNPFLVEYNGEYYPFVAYYFSNYGSYGGIKYYGSNTPLYKTTGIYFQSDPDAPLKPEDIEDFFIRPTSPYVGKGNSETFEAFYRYKNGDEVQAKDIEWYLRIESGDEVSSIDGIIISSLGSMITSENTTLDRITVVAKSEILNKSISTTAFIDTSYNPGDPVSPGGVPNPGNQYFPGGISGSSGRPGGSYDQSFGPNTSTLIPGVGPGGEGMMGGIGSVGNDIADSGMYTKYLCNQQMLNVLAQFFWEDNAGIQLMKLIFGNPIDSIISLVSYPFDISTLVPNERQKIFFGKYNSQLDGIALSRSSTQINWGTIPIDFYWGNFLDYAPYTQVQLYLPWGTGFVTIDPNEIMPYSENPVDYNFANYKRGSIRVITNIELDKGACVHHVIGNRGLVIGSYGGVVGKQIPMTALDQSAKMLALLGAASGVGMAASNAMAGAATGKYTSTMSVPFQIPSRGVYGPNLRQGVGSLETFDSKAMMKDIGSSTTMKGGLASAAALAHTPPNYPRAGTFSDATSSMVAQQPYIIISRPAQSVPQNYGHYNGYPSNIYYNKLSMVSGYTEISEIHLDNIPASIEELNELDSLLKGGVLL